MTDTPVPQDAATQTILSAVHDFKILSYEDAEEIFKGMRLVAIACADSPPYQPAPTPTWSEDEWSLGSPPNDDDLYGARYMFQTVSHFPHLAIVDKDVKLIKSW